MENLTQIGHNQGFYPPKNQQGFPYWGGTGGGVPALPEILACPPMPPHCFNPTVLIDFVIFMQFLAILSKLSPPTSRPQLGNPDQGTFFDFQKRAGEASPLISPIACL